MSKLTDEERAELRAQLRDVRPHMVASVFIHRSADFMTRLLDEADEAARLRAELDEARRRLRAWEPIVRAAIAWRDCIVSTDLPNIDEWVRKRWKKRWVTLLGALPAEHRPSAREEER